MKKITIMVAFLLPFMLNSQPWQWSKQFGGTGMDNAQIFHSDRQHNVFIRGDYARQIAPPWNGLNCIIDTVTLFGFNSSFIAKYNENGILGWVRNLAPNNYSLIRAVAFDSITESFFIAGIYYDSVNLMNCRLSESFQNFFLYKMDLTGNCIWSKSIGHCSYYSALTCDKYGNLFIAGSIPPGCNTIDTCQVEPGTFIAKFNPAGTCQWVKTITPYVDNFMYISTLIFQNDNLFALGTINGPGGNLIIDTINRQIPVNNNPMGIICMDSTAHVKWLMVDVFPMGGLGNNSCGTNNQGDLYCFTAIEGTTYIGPDTLIGKGTSRVVVKYNNEGELLGYNHLDIETTYYGQNGIGLSVQSDGTYYITGSFTGTATFGRYTITADKAPDMFLAHFTDSGECLGVDHVGGGHGTSIAADETGVYVTGVFSPQPSDTGSMTIGNATFHTYGFEDIIFAKHDLMTGVKEATQQDNNSLTIYANPNKGSFRVKIPADLIHEKKLVLSIYDNRGKLIEKQNLSLGYDTPGINIYGRPAGMYSITLSNGTKSYSGKMIVE